MSTVLDVESPAKLAMTLGVPVSSVLNAVRRLGLTPALSVDGRGYFAAKDCDRIAQAIKPAHPEPEAPAC
ncbi:MAG: hypothetical protein AAGJ38_01030 [Planctomycetota bacterium]